MPIQAILFDLDGTLADTAPSLGNALNSLLQKRGLPPKPQAQIRPHASHGSTALIRLGTGITPEHPDFPQWRADYLAEYEQCFDRDTALFPEINPLLARLATQNIAWGIITNKPQTFTNRLVPKLGFSIPPAVVVSGDTCPQAKPSPLPMRHACAALQVQPENCIYVGDAERDIQAGLNAGMQTILAAWGYIAPGDTPETWGYHASAANPLQILDILRTFQAA